MSSFNVNGAQGARQPEAHNAANPDTAIPSADLPHQGESSPTIDDSVVESGGLDRTTGTGHPVMHRSGRRSLKRLRRRIVHWIRFAGLIRGLGWRRRPIERTPLRAGLG
jgi:hypothetical protein